jgi:AcrR family transcriptional regulator
MYWEDEEDLTPYMALGVKLATWSYAGGMSDSRPIPMRERTRRLAQTELTAVAQDLFLEHGYEQTTVDQIAAAAGMSKRTFFRYFPSKDALVIGRFDLFGDRMADALDARPDDEPVWESLRRMFDITLDYLQDEHQRARNDAMEAIVRSTPQLYAGYLEKMQRIQQMLIGRVATRIGSSESVSDDLQAAAIVGAAFACLQAARASWFASDQASTFQQMLDNAMNVLTVQATPR